MIQLRPMTDADLDALQAIERDLFPDPWTRMMFRDSLCHPAVQAHVAGADAGVIGYCIGMFSADEAEILNIAVARAQQRNGIGTQLLDWMVAACVAQHVTRLFLEVRAGNLAAQQFYARHGFVPVGRRPGYYTVGCEDALVLCRTLA